MKVYACALFLLTLSVKGSPHGANARDTETKEENAVVSGPIAVTLEGGGGIRGSTTVLDSKQGYLSTDVTAAAASDLRVHELYTFGAPSVTGEPITARGNCVPGLRLYTENVMNWSWAHPSDFAAMFNQADPHPKMAMLMLNNQDPNFWNHNGGWRTAKYEYKPCKDSGWDQDYYWWPKNQTPNTKIHGMNENYLPRLKYFFFGEDSENTSVKSLWTRTPTDDGVPVDLIKNALLYGEMAQLNYEPMANACASDSDCACVNGRCNGEAQLDSEHYDPTTCASDSNCACGNGRCNGEAISIMNKDFPPGWELIKQGEVFSGRSGVEDIDDIKLFKKAATDECVFTFEGSNIEEIAGQQYDLGRFTAPGAGNMVTWCGKDNLHSGLKDELWTIMHSEAYEDFKPALAACHKVTCAGHSLGGALCDMWTHLANNGVEDSSDNDCWTKLAWWQ